MADVAMPNLEDFPVLPSGIAEVNKMIREHSDLFSDSQCKVCSAVLISESQKLTHYQSKKHANKVRRYLCIQNEKEKEPTVKKLKPADDDLSTSGILAETDKYKVCHVCNMTFSSPVVAESHYQGKVHSKNLRLKTVGPQHVQSPVFQTAEKPVVVKKKKEEPEVVAMDSSEGGGGGEKDKFCSICQASFNNPMMAQQHYAGKKHKKHMTKMKLMETYGPSTAPTVKGYPCTVCNIELNSVEQYQAHISGAKHKNQVKKSSMAPADGDNNQFQSGGGGGDPGESQFPGGDASETTGAGEESQQDAGENEYPAGDAPYTAEGINQYSEEYLYT